VPEVELTLDLLCHGRVEVLGRIPWGSNATLLAEVYAPDDPEAPEPALRAVYKPRKGERPLWDFPGGLDRREVAAYELSEALGWALVPETILRDDLPFGSGSLQLFVPFDGDAHYFTLVEDPAHHQALQMICLFDLVTNQADRKSGHCLLGEGRTEAVHIWAVDNGLAFHREMKLRTVIWDFAGLPVPPSLRHDLERLVVDGLPDQLHELLDEEERTALLERARVVSQLELFPHDPTGRRVPWPPV
jgi:uncharacterized repeat protein (TIGR03843 family)